MGILEILARQEGERQLAELLHREFHHAHPDLFISEFDPPEEEQEATPIELPVVSVDITPPEHKLRAQAWTLRRWHPDDGERIIRHVI